MREFHKCLSTFHLTQALKFSIHLSNSSIIDHSPYLTKVERSQKGQFTVNHARFNPYIIELHEIRKRKAKWIGHILRRNCLLKQVIEGKIKGEMEVSRRRGRRSKKLLDDLKDRRGYFHLKEEAPDYTMWRNRFRGGFEPVVRQNTE